MIGASKILTVSYGTFSCTLEGFDDSFDTMKAISEYFRDLAADDRYFGAEPATPDTEMLAKIAGSQIQQQVEAKVGNSGIVLRPLEQAEDAITQVEPQPVAVADPIVNEATASVIVPSSDYDDAQDDARAEIITEDAPAAAAPESVAAKLRRIRAVVAQNQTAGIATPIFSEEQHVEEFLPDAEVQDEPVIVPVEDITVDEVSETDETADQAADHAIEDDDTTDDVNIHDLMNRVSDEAVNMDEAPADVAETFEDEDYESEGQTGDEDDSDILDVIADGTDDIEDEQDIIAEDVSAKIDESTEDDAPQEHVKPVRPSRARVIKVKKSDLAEDAQEDDAGVEAENSDDTVEDIAAEEAQPVTLGETGLSAENDADLRADLADVEQETTSDTEPDASDAIDQDAPLGFDISELDAGIDAALRTDRSNRALHDEGGAEDEAAVSRLLDETNAKLGTQESSRRRSAISHLRAAVAATVADRKFKKAENAEKADEVDAYRTDLADVMRPKHVSAEADSDIEHSAPLILVSEQRIDEDEPSSPMPTIRPHRIVKGDVTLHEVESDTDQELSVLLTTGVEGDSVDDKGADIIADSTSFADFADKMGATELPDLLEAAAAYTAYVEGRPHFARPQIIRQVAGFAGKEEFNREEGLRLFGQLLRQGKIIKVKRGQFEIAETTRFKPEARYAGE